MAQKAVRSQFITRLHETLTLAEFPDALHWVSNDTFEITVDEEQACQALSPAWDFRSLSSFIRQLSYYGFKRLSDRRRSIERKAGVSTFVIFAHPSGFFVRDDVTQLERILRKSRTRKAALVPGKRQRRSSAASTVLKEESPSNEAVAGPSRGQPPPDDPSRAQWPPTASGSGPRPNDLPLPPTSYLPPLPGNLYAPPPPQAYYSNPSLTYFNSSVYSPVPTQHFSPDFSLRNPAPLSPLDPHFLPSHSPKTHDPTRFLPSHSPKIHEPPLAPLPRDPTDYYAPRTVYSYQEGRNQLDEAVEQNSRIDPYLVGVRAGANVNYYAQPKSSLGIYAEAR